VPPGEQAIAIPQTMAWVSAHCQSREGALWSYHSMISSARASTAGGTLMPSFVADSNGEEFRIDDFDEQSVAFRQE
jgi:hypothetical protein